jgi:hypothetical protein
MLYLDVVPESSGSELLKQLQAELSSLDPDAVVRIRLGGPHAGAARAALTTATLRELAPPTMNVTVAPDRTVIHRVRRRGPGTP